MNTAKEMYEYFLQQVRKERNTTISPQQWTDRVNPVVLDWVKTKLPEREFNQKRIDDLQAILETNTLNAMSDGYYQLPANYMSGIYARFKHEDERNHTVFVPGKILRTDVKTIYQDNPYRQEDGFLYFQTRVNFIVLQGHQDEIKHYKQCDIGYYKYPLKINWDGTNDLPGSFKPMQNKEIMDMVVTQYLEGVSDPRIQTQPSVQAQIPK